MPHESPLPPINLPTNVTIWDFFFGPTSTIARTPPSQIASFVDASTDVSISFHLLKTLCTHLSTALTKHHGLRPGQTVSLFSANTIYYPVALFGALRVGGVVSSASPAYTVDEMVYALEKAEAKFLFTLPGSIKVAAEAAARVGMKKERVFLLEGKMEGFTTLQELVEQGAREGERGQTEEFRIPEERNNGDLCGFLSFSSGTTGLPKAVMISHQNVIAQCLQVQAVTTVELTRVVAALPLFHITGLVHVLHVPLLINTSVISLPQFTVPLFLDAVTRYRVHELLVVPPILIRLIRDPIVDSYDLTHVRRWSCGAAPLSREVILELQRKFPSVGMKHGYGMTESCSCVTVTVLGEDSYENAHTVGRVCASTTIKIVDERGEEVAPGMPGEMLVRGPQVTMGYLGNEKATAETFEIDADGGRWLRTGDVATVDEYGRVTITDRIKEMIKVNGVQVAPAELEDLLMGHPKVEDVAVLGVAHELLGEVPKAFVVLKQEHRAEAVTEKGRAEAEAELVAYVKKNRGAKAKWLGGGVRFVESVPKSPSGKILRRVLKDQEKREAERTGGKARL